MLVEMLRFFMCPPPMTLIALVWNTLIKKYEIRSLGLISWRDLITKKHNIGFYIGCLMFMIGITAWLRPDNYWLYFLSAVAVIINIFATMKANRSSLKEAA